MQGLCGKFRFRIGYPADGKTFMFYTLFYVAE